MKNCICEGTYNTLPLDLINKIKNPNAVAQSNSCPWIRNIVHSPSIPNIHYTGTWGPWATNSLLQPFWPVWSIEEETPNLTRLQRSEFTLTDLVASHAVLLHLLKFALELSLPLHFLLSTTHINELPVQFFAVHLIHSLLEESRTIVLYMCIRWLSLRQEVNYVSLTTLSWTDPLGVFVPLKTHKSKASGLSIFISHDTDAHGRTLSNEEKVLVMCKSIENNSV